MLWFVFAILTAAAMFAVLWPLSRRAQPRDRNDLAVYRDQLNEIARDQAASLIGVAEVNAAKVEVSPRLIAAADTTDWQETPAATTSLIRRRATAAAALYLALGSPAMPGESLTPRLAAIHGSSIAGLIAQVERHLASNPNDARGWEVVAPVYLRLGRYDEAVNARRKFLALRGANAEREADLGEALMAAANGVVTDAAKAAFDKAAALGPKDVKSHFYTAVAAEQDGKRDQAVAIWRGVLADAPPGASWADNVREVLAQLGAAPNVAAAPGPSASNIAAVSQTSEQDRSDLIQSIVARLPEKLKQYGSDIDSWQRLLRGYIVLGERGKAAAAANDARHALAAGSDKLKKIDDMIKSLGLDG